MRRALRPGGIVCSQGGTVWANSEHVAQTLSHCQATFPAAAYACAAVPTYPTGQIGFVLGSLDEVCSTLFYLFQNHKWHKFFLKFFVYRAQNSESQ